MWEGLTTSQLKDLDCRLILGNTYHLGLRPGPELLGELGGLHKFMDWDNSLLTDSGGFQMVSLLSLAEIDETGVKFLSPHDGSQLLLTPEKSIELQNVIGSDIMMQLDDVVSGVTTGPRVEVRQVSPLSCHAVCLLNFIACRKRCIDRFDG